MNFHHSGADRGRRFPWFTNGHIKTTKLTFADSEPTDPSSHVPTRNRREWRREVGNPRRRRWMPSPTSTRRGRLTTPCWPRAGASSTPDTRCVDAAPKTTDAQCPTTRSPRGAHRSNPPPPPALLTTPPTLAPVPPRDACVQEINERDAWTLKPGGKYFFTRNMSAVCAFAVGGSYVPGSGFVVVGAHTDSPCPKLKPNTKATSERFLQVRTQNYGGGLWYTWFDRDLGVAGRVVVKRAGVDEKARHALVKIDRPVMRIPSLAIHLNREMNNGFAVNFQQHMVTDHRQRRGGRPRRRIRRRPRTEEGQGVRRRSLREERRSPPPGAPGARRRGGRVRPGRRVRLRPAALRRAAEHDRGR